MDKKQQVMQWLEDHKQDYVELLQKLVRIPSISGNEYDVQMAVKEYAEAHGFTVEAKAFDPEGKRPNLRITYPGSGGGKRLMLDATPIPFPWSPVKTGSTILSPVTTTGNGSMAAARPTTSGESPPF